MNRIAATLIAFCTYSLILFSCNEGISCREEHERTRHARQHFRNFHAESSPSLREFRNVLAPLLHDQAINCDGETPVITFALNQRGLSGGFGDRLLGMVTTYYLAIMTNSSFAVHWTRPYNLNDFFALPSCDGPAAGAKHQKPKRSPDGDGCDVVSLSSELPDDGGKEIVRTAIDFQDWKYFTDSLFLNDTGKDSEIITNSFHWKEVVRNDAFRERAARLNLSNLSQAELFKLAIDELFRNPMSVVRKSFESLMQRLADGHANDVPYVGVQIRLGGKNNNPVSGWVDPSRHSLEQLQCFAAEAVRVCRRMRIESIFVTADSEEAVRAFEDAVRRESASASKSSHSPPPVVIQVPGIIGHTDRSSVVAEHASDVWLKSILDWWVLKHASALVISRSGFGETAAMSSDAETAVRLKLSSGSSAATSAGGEIMCDFEELLLNDKDVIRFPW